MIKYIFPILFLVLPGCTNNSNDLPTHVTEIPKYNVGDYVVINGQENPALIISEQYINFQSNLSTWMYDVIFETGLTTRVSEKQIEKLYAKKFSFGVDLFTENRYIRRMPQRVPELGYIWENVSNEHFVSKN